MDNLPGYIAANLPPSILAHMSSHSSTYWRVYKSALAARDTTLYYTAPVLHSLRQLNPDLTSFLLLALLLLLALKLLDMLRAAIMFWVRLAYRLILYGGFLTLGLWVYARGIDGAVDDARHAIDWVVQYWSESYDQYKRQEELARVAQRFAGNNRRGWFGQ